MSRREAAGGPVKLLRSVAPVGDRHCYDQIAAMISVAGHLLRQYCDVGNTAFGQAALQSREFCRAAAGFVERPEGVERPTAANEHREGQNGALDTRCNVAKALGVDLQSTACQLTSGLTGERGESGSTRG